MPENKWYNLFTWWTIIFVILMPFYVLTKVFFEHKVWIPYFGFFIKELLIVLLWILVVIEFCRKKIIPKFDILDILVFSYFAYGIGITLINGLSLGHLVHWGRYDFFFLAILLLYKHWAQFLSVGVDKIIKYFLLSASSSIFIGIMVKFLLWEERLLFFWFTDYSAYWTFDGAVPTHHGLENSKVKRFQGILEWPNAMGYFLIVYTALLLHIQKIKFQFHNVLLVVFMFWLVLMTYSRSALLGIWVAGISLILLNLKYIYYRVRKYILPILGIFIVFFWILWLVFQEKIYNAVIRPWSTTGHFERMEIWIDRFKESPFGSWLATSGPAFRNVHTWEITREDEEYYIPESWFIQQLTEWGFIYFSLFLLIFAVILWRLYKVSQIVTLGLIAVLVMNIFLHIFESTHLSYVFFAIIWILIAKHNGKYFVHQRK
jgi:hypothetical protein